MAPTELFPVALLLACGVLPLPLPETDVLSTTLRLPANDCAMRFAVSRSLAEGTEPVSVMESSDTLTATFELLREGSLRNAVWMSLRSWSEDCALPETEPVLPLCDALLPACALLPAAFWSGVVEDCELLLGEAAEPLPIEELPLADGVDGCAD